MSTYPNSSSAFEGGDDNLSALGIGWDEEGHVRNTVVAQGSAAGSEEARAEQKILQKAWKELEQAEHTLNQLSSIPEQDLDSRQRREMSVLESQTIPSLVSRVERLQKEHDSNKVRRLLEEKNKLSKQQEEERRRAATAAATASSSSSVGGEHLKQEGAGNADGVISSHLIQPGPTSLFSLSAASRLLKRQQSSRLAQLFKASGSRGHPHHELTPSVEVYRGGEILPTPNAVTARTSGNKRPRAHGGNREHADDDENDGAVVIAPSAVDDSSERSYIQRVMGVMDGEEDPEMVEVVQGSNLFMRNDIFMNLLDYQKVGLQWLLNRHLQREGGILGDEMGLGKTVQIAALINTLHTSGELHGPVLIVAPLTVMWQWVAELQKWAPMVRSCIYHSGSSSARTESLVGGYQGAKQAQSDLLAESKGKPYVLITTYAGMRNNIRALLDVGFQYVILDEGHKISNPNAEITTAAKTFITPHRIILSGSPIQNTLKELWCLFDFAKKGLLGTQARFIEEFETPISHSRNTSATRLEQSTAVQCAALLRQHIDPYLLRRLKKDVRLNLPPKHERIIRCSLSDEQLRLYVQFLLSSDVQAVLNQAADNRDLQSFKDGGAGFLQDGSFVSFSAHKGGLTRDIRYRVYHMLSRLRFICNHVDLFKLRVQDLDEGGSGKGLSFRSNLPVNYEGSDKLNKLRLLMREWKKHGHKVLVVSQYVMMLDIIENCVDQEGHRYIRMDGSTPGQNRQILVDKFNRDPSIFVALLTTKVGGLGLNLTGADRVVIFDPDWNPVVDTQAKERSWRIGQRREVCIYRMVVSGTIEEHILHRQLAKTYVSEKVLKDPTLQRFFSSNSLVDTLFLSPEVYAKRLIPSIRRRVCTSNTIDDEVRDTDFDDDAGEEGSDTVVLHPDRHLSGVLGGASAAAVANRGGVPSQHRHRDADGGMVLTSDHAEAVRNEISAVLKEEREEEAAHRHSIKREKEEDGDSGKVQVKVEESNETSVISNLVDARGVAPTRLPSSRDALFEHALASASASRTFARVLESSSSLSSRSHSLLRK